MSGSISGLTGLLGTLVQDSSNTREQLTKLTAQAGDGKIARDYAGLASGGQASLTLEPALAHNQIWQGNIDAAKGRMDVTQTVLSQISQIADSFYDRADSLNGLDSSTVDTVAASARDALRQIAGLLNTRDGSLYVFGGQDSGTPPVPNPDQIASSGFFAQIAAAVANLGTTGAAAATQATLAIAGSNAAGTSPFTAVLSQSQAALADAGTSVQVGDNQHVPFGILASANAQAISAGGSTTGSYMRDIMRGLATLGALSSAQLGTAGFADLVSDTRTSLGNAVSALNDDAGILGERSAALTAAKTNLSNTNLALQRQISSAEDVDMAATLSALTRTQTQLQASYQLIAALQSLSLTKYLSDSEYPLEFTIA